MDRATKTAPKQPTCPPSAVADQIIRCDELREGDLMLWVGALVPVETAYMHHTPELGERVHVELGAGGPHYTLFPHPSDYTAVRRYVEG